METSKIKNIETTMLPRVFVELENGKYISNDVGTNDLNIRMGDTCRFNICLNETEVRELVLLLETYIEARYGNIQDKE